MEPSLKNWVSGRLTLRSTLKRSQREHLGFQIVKCYRRMAS
jgi:hypothetical protein